MSITSTKTQELKFHPLADLVPSMRDSEYEDLKADIKANGLLMPIVLFEGKVLDGRHRLRACRAVDVEPRFTEGADWIGDPAGFVLSANIHRRHLDAKQKRDVIAKLIKAQPEKSDRQIGKQAKVDGKTVAEVRQGMEARAEIPHVETRTDTKGRKQRAKKKGKKHRRRFCIDTSDGRRLYEDEARAHLEQMQKQRAADSARVAKVLIDRVGVENLTLVYAAMFLKSGEVYLDEIINIPGTYGAEVCAKANDGNYTVADFFAMYGNGESPTADDGLDIRECLRRSAP
jgi:hypothetical protein